ncbi:hypothetical protein [Chthonomonas calidirosea]|uniref:Uncharacterized protein n=1 Tax=Chthonomonas calidirosea (strain DSM 23976 / ICMP 18418 / T49) TaxID=1303518 RepID=S0EVB9_CHTCT|nr:hypothetical protein [Chthonomonas calidirosea]CCW35720.1 hypothetical protein CCALI_01912 [Chthonomonas calidirosea T49]CEK18431.1 hypothetical protein CP488_02182 [Chthonomonas calidirosea]CEK19439.1 hypothetical protein CTKA_02183 [Chthonomonas calidirosea]
MDAFSVGVSATAEEGVATAASEALGRSRSRRSGAVGRGLGRAVVVGAAVAVRPDVRAEDLLLAAFAAFIRAFIRSSWRFRMRRISFARIRTPSS